MKINIIRAISAMCVLSALAATCACGKDGGSTTAPATTQEITEAATNAPVKVNEGANPLTGLDGYEDRYVNVRPVGIVVENTPQARPQWGTGTSDICIEYEVEGGISRMLWLYANPDRIPAKVGPVRSGRHDVQELALGFDAVFVCWGKSSLATAAAANDYTIDEVDGMYSASYFAKDDSRQTATEHRGYTTGENLKKAFADKGLRTTVKDGYYGVFNFASKNAPVTLPDGTGNKVHVSFSGSYEHDFTYDPSTALYTNSMGGKAMTDENGNEDKYRNVIILLVDSETLSTKHVDLKLENGGAGYIVSGGGYAAVKWTKGIYSDRLSLTYTDGSPVTLNAGRSYIGFVRSTRASSNTIG